MRGDELRVVDAFERFLKVEGWRVEREVEFVDLLAHRDDDILYVEAKGRVGANTGLDVDTMFGQLLRRMKEPRARYAVVVPTEGVRAVQRVPKSVREVLRIDVYEVDSENRVKMVE